jgi:hypothetical protein
MKKPFLVPLLLFLLPVASGFTQNLRNILIDDITATACSHCACMDSVLNQIVKVRHPNTIILAIQGPSSLFYLPKMDSLMFCLGFQGTGTKINRQYNDQSVETMADSVDGRYLLSPEAPVKLEVLSKAFNPQTREIDLSIRATSLIDGLDGTFRINLAITEDHLMGPQQHDPGCPGSNPYPYDILPHYNVVRDIILTTNGELLINGIWNKDLALTRNYHFKLDTTAVVPENSNIVIYVDKKGDTLGQSAIQQAIVQSVTRPVGIPENQSGQGFSISLYPNPPAHGTARLHLSTDRYGWADVALFDLLGRKLQDLPGIRVSPGSNLIPIPVPELKAGIYIIESQLNNKKVLTRLVIL